MDSYRKHPLIIAFATRLNTCRNGNLPFRISFFYSLSIIDTRDLHFVRSSFLKKTVFDI